MAYDNSRIYSGLVNSVSGTVSTPRSNASEMNNMVNQAYDQLNRTTISDADIMARARSMINSYVGTGTDPDTMFREIERSGMPLRIARLAAEELIREQRYGGGPPRPGSPNNPVQVAVQEVAPSKKRGRPKKEKILTVAETISHFNQLKQSNYKWELEHEQARIAEEEAQLLETQKRLRIMKNKVDIKTKKHEEMLKKSKGEMKKYYEGIVKQLEDTAPIVKFQVDKQKRIIVTTKPLAIKKEKWKKEKVAGQYQIRIDFLQGSVSSGVRVLNITKRCDDYDSPTISNTGCCWGNLENDVRDDFVNQDLYELIMDMIAYIQSPNDQHGYLHRDGNDGWEVWFKGAKKVKEGYSFEEWDKEYPSTQTVREDHAVGPSYLTEPLQYSSEAISWSTTTLNSNMFYGNEVHMAEMPQLSVQGQPQAEPHSRSLLEQPRAYEALRAYEGSNAILTSGGGGNAGGGNNTESGGAGGAIAGNVGIRNLATQEDQLVNSFRTEYPEIDDVEPNR